MWVDDLRKKHGESFVLPNDGVPVNGIGTIESSLVHAPPVQRSAGPSSSPTKRPANDAEAGNVDSSDEGSSEEEETEGRENKRTRFDSSTSHAHSTPPTTPTRGDSEEPLAEVRKFRKLMNSQLGPACEAICDSFAEHAIKYRECRERNEELEREKEEAGEEIQELKRGREADGKKIRELEARVKQLEQSCDRRRS